MSATPAVVDAQLMPSNPCMGVESWNKPGCPGESIWTEGAKLLEGAGKKYNYGMAINPVQRRGMHQVGAQ